MKRLYVWLMLGWMSVGMGPLLGQTTSYSEWKDSSAYAPQTQVMPVDTWLWRISHPYREKVSYLYGIMPELPGGSFSLPERVRLLARQTERLVLAIDLDKPPMDAIHRVEVPLDSTLEVLLPEGTYTHLYRWVADSLSSLSKLKLDARYPPSVLARQFLSDYCLDPVRGQESVMVEYQLKHQLELPLEVVGTGWTRLAWLDSYSYREQTQQLLHLVEDREAQCEIYQAVVRAYGRGDLDHVWLLSQSAPDMGYNLGRLLEARNKAWMRYLNLNLPYHSLFIAVNAAQLSGEYGLVHQLRKAGYEVKALP